MDLLALCHPVWECNLREADTVPRLGISPRYVEILLHSGNSAQCVVDDQARLAKQWYQASVECLTTAKYQQNHNGKVPLLCLVMLLIQLSI